MTLHFSKMHGAGNDFVVLDLRAGAPPPSPALSRALADRHAGIGCDQILTIEPARSSDAVASYRIWNADGSQAQQCGNGARCVAAWLLRDGATTATSFQLDSPAGTHAVTRLPGDRYAIAMGMPQFAPQAVPLLGWDEAQDDYVVEIDGQAVHLGAVSMGNPHALVESRHRRHGPGGNARPRLAATPGIPRFGQCRFCRSSGARPHPPAGV